MLANLDPVILARIQFAFTISFHIVFPAFTIGLASWLAVARRQQLTRMWIRIAASAPKIGNQKSFEVELVRITFLCPKDLARVLFRFGVRRQRCLY